ncbi:unnamed protein product [Gongylonema pulchrum]|uniref:PDZ domain-containing protein n=1 Tax=Gongylonema pulchrum TaxID=637853 RepID=A0A183EIB5_9BILA|nr:unnamed protein product [Gongylonema pulchrum]
MLSKRAELDVPPSAPLYRLSISADPLYVNKSLCTKVTRVEPRGASIGRVGVGDKIVAINGVKLNNIHELNEQLAKPAKEASVTLNRAGFSCCKHACTTVETLTIEKGSSMKVMRAVELYRVQIRLEPFPDMDLGQELGLSVKYDNKERLQVASVVPGTLASVHLRPGDIIRLRNNNLPKKVL